MGIGGLIFAAASLLGLHIVLAAVPALYAGLKLAGAAYLLYLAFRLWAGAHTPMGIELGRSGRTGRSLKSFRLGLLTQLSNPKAAIVYASIFTALLPVQQNQWSAAWLLFSIFAIEAGWYVIVAIAFSSERPRRCYLRSKLWIDRGASMVMALLAMRLILDVPLQDRR
jgi:threonine/homoserine/homoserine lactone efflux protein